MTATHLFAAALAFAALPMAHAQGLNKPMEPAPSASSAAMPLVDAEIRKLDLDKGLIVPRHGDIPNLAMPAMTMGFDVTDKKMLDGRVEGVTLNGLCLRLTARIQPGRRNGTVCADGAPATRRQRSASQSNPQAGSATTKSSAVPPKVCAIRIRTASGRLFCSLR